MRPAGEERWQRKEDEVGRRNLEWTQLLVVIVTHQVSDEKLSSRSRTATQIKTTISSK